MIRDIPVHVWVSALVRRAELGGAFAMIVNRGDPERGDVLVKVVHERGRARLYGPAFSMEGPTEFEELCLDVTDCGERAIDEKIASRTGMDRDLWVVEIEDREGRHFLTERVRNVRDTDNSRD